MVKQVTLYTKKHCPLCDDAKNLLLMLKETIPFHFQEVDIYQDDQLLEQYQLMIPVIAVDGEQVDYGQIDLLKIESALKK